MTSAPPAGWNERLLEQLTFHWDGLLRPKLDGLSDEELFWEPVANCWSIRPRSEARTEVVGGSGDLVSEWAFPEPDPPPFTTIAWRLVHVTVGCFGMRTATHFDGPPVDYFTYENPASAAQALADLDEGYERWVAGVRSLGLEGLERKVGDGEGVYAEHTFADLIPHIHREVIHHGAEILMLRELYRNRPLAGETRDS